MLRVLTLSRVRFSLVIVAGLVTTALLLTGSAALSAQGATYTGTTATGAPVSITVNADRTAVTAYHFGTVDSRTPLFVSPCGTGFPYEFWYQAWFEPIPISSGSFSHTAHFTSDFAPFDWDRVVQGTFFGAQVVGTFAMVFPDAECNGGVSWTATTTPAPGESLNGDLDCNGAVTIGDAEKIARKQIGLGVSQEARCPEIGQAVQ